MISIIHYISAKRRLEESNKTIRLLGGEIEAPPMLLAQRDMIQHEVEYYQDRLIKLAIYSLGVALCVVVCYTVYIVFDKIGII